MRDLKKEDFGEFLKLVEERESDIRELLTAANDLVNTVLYTPASCAESVSTSLSSGLNLSREIAAVPLGSNNGDGSATSEGALAVVQRVHTQGSNPLQTPDAFSGSDLDVLLAYSYQQAGECKLNSIRHKCCLWQSVRFDEPAGSDELATWFPYLQRSSKPLRRYQIVPFHYTERWQLAIFDVVEFSLVCYDTMWTSGSPESIFLVSQALCATVGLETNTKA